jgi:hypothetical protein
MPMQSGPALSSKVTVSVSMRPVSTVCTSVSTSTVAVASSAGPLTKRLAGEPARSAAVVSAIALCTAPSANGTSATGSAMT